MAGRLSLQEKVLQCSDCVAFKDETLHVYLIFFNHLQGDFVVTKFVDWMINLFANNACDSAITTLVS